tara:strand:- start:1052 stop:1294 length:243 start_codon:yes stop_codon:yes gene_type:complete
MDINTTHIDFLKEHLEQFAVAWVMDDGWYASADMPEGLDHSCEDITEYGESAGLAIEMLYRQVVQQLEGPGDDDDAEGWG